MRTLLLRVLLALLAIMLVVGLVGFGTVIRHYDDMIDPWPNIEYHPMLWARADMEADAEGVLVLRP
jgi:hypothetical protein